MVESTIPPPSPVFKGAATILIMARNGWRGRLRQEAREWNELLDPAADLVADWPDDVDSLADRVIEGPVFVALTWVVGAGVAATHGDHDFGRLGR